MTEVTPNQNNIGAPSASSVVSPEKIPGDSEPRTRGRLKSHKLAAFLFRGSRKFATISIVIIIACIISSTVILINYFSNPVDNPVVEQEQTIANKISDIGSQADSILSSGAIDSYDQALNYLDEQIDSSIHSNDPELTLQIKLYKATFLSNTGNAKTAIPELLAIDESELTDREKGELYIVIIFAYNQIGNTSLAQSYQDKYNALPEDSKGAGGGS